MFAGAPRVDASNWRRLGLNFWTDDFCSTWSDYYLSDEHIMLIAELKKFNEIYTGRGAKPEDAFNDGAILSVVSKPLEGFLLTYIENAKFSKLLITSTHHVNKRAAISLMKQLYLNVHLFFKGDICFYLTWSNVVGLIILRTTRSYRPDRSRCTRNQT